MKVGTESLVKFKRLQRRLGIPLWQATGLLESVWRATAQNTPDGALGRLSNEDIAAAIEWADAADDLVDALVDSGWLDRDEEFRLIVHDWSEHCSNYLRGNFAKHNKTFADIAAKQRSMEVAKQSQNGTSNGATNPSQSYPIQSTPTPTTEQGDAGGPVFEMLWDQSRLLAVRFGAALEPDPARRLSKRDREWVIQVAILGNRYGPAWYEPAFEAIKNTRDVKSPRGLMSTVLNSECERLHSTLNRELATVKVPSDMLVPKAPTLISEATSC